MIALEELQVEIGGVVFGADTDATLESIRGLGSGRLNAREYEIPDEDGTAFGRERRPGRVIDFAGQVIRSYDPAGAWDRSSELADVFDGEGVRLSARDVMPLRLRRPGKQTVVLFGRPEEYDPDHTRAVIGLVPFTATFRTADLRFYSDTEHTVALSIGSSSAGGLVTDENGYIASPISTVAGTKRTSIVENAGDAPTWPVIEIHGPVTGPSVTLLDDNGGVLWRLGVKGSLAHDQTAVIDTRPWSRGAYLDSGSSLGGLLTLESIPSLSTLPPGASEFVVAGADGTGTASFDIRWRDAYRTI